MNVAAPKPLIEIVPRLITLDRRRRNEKAEFNRARRAEIQYGVRLRKVAAHIGEMIRGFAPDDLASALGLRSAMERYAEALQPWAEAVGRRMLEEVAARDKEVWRVLSGKIGRALHREIESAPTGEVMRQLLVEQVGLITGMPVEAAQRVHDLTIAALTDGRRAAEVAAEIMRSGEVAKGRADLIARTEVGRAATALTQARAQYVGSTSYIWRTARDGRVRETHRHLEGKVFRWDDPPECDPGYHAHPGAIFNCRCYPEVIIPD